MERFTGKSISKRIAIGRIWFYNQEENEVQSYTISDVELEWNRFQNAKEKAIDELQAIYDKAVLEVGEVNAAIFEIHMMMLEDDDYNESVKNMIEAQKVNAEYAVSKTGENFSKIFAEMDDDYFKARSIDVKDISERLVRTLQNRKSEKEIEEPVILVAKDLAPSETVQLDKSKLLGFVTKHGSSNSHTAILARTMNIPALIGVPIDSAWNGKMAVLDGDEGALLIDPDPETLELMKAKQEKEKEQELLLQEMKGKESVSKSGQKINLYANIGNTSDLAKVLDNDAEGIGLFRSEFLYLESEDYPTEEEQFEKYKIVAETLAGKKVIIRTLDIGADKQVDYFELGKEDNPALGFRAIRICLERPEIFKTQLRAILRASAYGNIAIMYPMIISLEEVLEIKKIFEEVKKELDAADIPYGNVEQGIMIETPAAALVSDELAKEVDFFSIGTNDLNQYTLAIDRQNPNLERFANPHHKAVLRLIKMVVDNGHAGGCWVGICGELGADTELTQTFVDMGIDELSVSPGMVLKVRKAIRESE